ncbi:thioredoxin-dependent peroxidase, partial [Athelia psychrophila]
MATPTLKVGDTIPKGEFGWIEYTPELKDLNACGLPTTLSTDSWKGKKVVLFSVPGAFTPTCHANHIPPYIERFAEFKAKGVDVIAVIAANDAFVMSGWGRSLGVEDKILTLADYGATWSKQLGLSLELGPLGTRTARYAVIIDDLVIKYLEVEPAKGVTVSGAEAVLNKL